MQSTLERKIFFAARPGVDLVVHGMTAGGQPVLSKEMLTDRTRWRLGVNGNPPNLTVTPAADGLRLTVAPIRVGGITDPGVYPLDTPAPLASVRATKLQSRLVGDQRVSFGSVSISEQIAGTARALPRLGTKGVMVDLEYADRLSADFGAGESLEVWLNDSAPPDIVKRLQDQGLIVLADDSIDGTAEQYASFGPPLTLQFMLLSAVIGLLLAIGSASVVGAVERRPRARELGALRAQGAPAGLVKRVSIEGYIVLAVASLLFGLILAAVIRAYIGDVLPYFADGWSAP
jgi:hypothetical protein